MIQVLSEAIMSSLFGYKMNDVGSNPRIEKTDWLTFR